MSSVTSSDAVWLQASAADMESAMEDATWSIDVLPHPQPSDVEPQDSSRVAELFVGCETLALAPYPASIAGAGAPWCSSTPCT